MRVIDAEKYDLAARRNRPPWTKGQLGRAARIVEDVRSRGVEAVLDWSERLDGARPVKLVLKRADIESLASEAEPEAKSAIDRAAARIERFCRAQLKSLRPVMVSPGRGVSASTRIIALDSAGAYVPGGRHPLISSALMSLLPAKVAGVGRLVAASPPRSNGGLDPAMACALLRAGAHEVLLAGGAQAIAAMAFGIEGFAPADKIVGPGGVHVAAAKYLVSSSVGIDMIAGPSEVLILADDRADPELIAADLLAQAEHDEAALPLLFTNSTDLAAKVNREIRLAMADLPTAAVARRSLRRGAIVIFRALDLALEAANDAAAEHLELHMKDAERRSRRLRHFGSLFVGEAAAEVLGDYSAGINHTLPTSGAARWRGGLSPLDFVKAQTILSAEPGPGAADLADLAATLADIEGLPAHARAARLRLRSAGKSRRK